MESLLGRIIQNRANEVEVDKKETPLSLLKDKCREADAPRGFASAIASQQGPAIIAELKKASPTKGLLCPDFDVKKIAENYSRNGAAALSVLTEKSFFQGDLQNIAIARSVSQLPVLRKDFMIDEYQVYEARAAGADAILIIAAALERSVADHLAAVAHELGLDVLLEVHSLEEIRGYEDFKYDVIGVNNRNLKTGEVTIDTSLVLASEIPGGACKISESGIKNSSDIRSLSAAGFKGFLIGETLVKSPNPGEMLRSLLNE